MELDAASRLRLALLPLISGGTRDRNGSGIEFKTRTYRPTAPIPGRVHVWFDPEDLRTIALTSVSGEFICDGIARDLPLEIALSLDEVRRLYRPSEQTKERTKQARRNLYEILLANAEGRPVTRREASALDEAFANAKRPMARRDPLIGGVEPVDPADDGVAIDRAGAPAVALPDGARSRQSQRRPEPARARLNLAAPVFDDD